MGSSLYTRCKICRAPSFVRDHIDSLLHKKTSSTKIIKYAAKYDLKVSKQTVSKHNLRHRKPLMDMRAKGGGIKKKYDPAANRAIREARANVANGMDPAQADAKAMREIKANAKKIVTHSQFLNSVIDDVAQRLQNKQLVPSLTEALKAAEILQKMEKTQSPLEEALTALVQGISLGHSSQPIDQGPAVPGLPVPVDVQP